MVTARETSCISYNAFWQYSATAMALWLWSVTGNIPVQLGNHCIEIKVEVQPYSHTRTHPFNGPFSGTSRVSRYQKGKTNLDFTEARDSEWHWHQLGHMQVCTSLQIDNHASTPPLSFRCPSCRPTNSIKALKAKSSTVLSEIITTTV